MEKELYDINTLTNELYEIGFTNKEIVEILNNLNDFLVNLNAIVEIAKIERRLENTSSVIKAFIKGFIKC